MNKALFVIDAQGDFTTGALRNEHAIKALSVIKKVVKFAHCNFEVPIYYTRDTHMEDYLETQEGKNLPIPHCIHGTDGWRICKEVFRKNSFVFDKGTFGCIDLWRSKSLRLCDEIWICGFCTDICVSANFQILKAAFPEVPIVIIEDACAGTTPEMHEAALKVMKSCQATVVKWEYLKDKMEKNNDNQN